MVLQGDLGTWSAAELLNLLAATAKTGCLRIQGDAGEGAVLVRDGRLTAAVTNRVPAGPADEAVSDLLRYGTGTFQFEANEQVIGDAAEAMDDVLERAEMLLAEWEALLRATPTLEAWVRLADELPHGRVTVTAPQWRALAAVADGTWAMELANALGTTELGVLRTIHDLVSLGVATLHPMATTTGPWVGARHPPGGDDHG